MRNARIINGKVMKNKYEVFSWVRVVIKSCTTTDHLDGAYNLAMNFMKLYNDSHLYKLLLGDICERKKDLKYSLLYD